MVKIYLRKIIEGAITVEDVPRYWRDEVEALLIKRNIEQ